MHCGPETAEGGKPLKGGGENFHRIHSYFFMTVVFLKTCSG